MTLARLYAYVRMLGLLAMAAGVTLLITARPLASSVVPAAACLGAATLLLLLSIEQHS